MAGSSSSPSSKMVPIPIEDLTSAVPRWTITALVTNKTKKRDYNNDNGQGNYFSMDLLDKSGEIRATAFNAQCDKFYDKIKVGKVYSISWAKVKKIPEEHRGNSPIKNKYEISFTKDTDIKPCNDVRIPPLHLEFVLFSDLQERIGHTIDVIGICKEVYNIQLVTRNDTNEEAKKRDVILLDCSGTEVSLTLWNEQAEDFDGRVKDVVAARGVRVREFNGGVSLSPIKHGWVHVNPNIPESRALRDWYRKEVDRVQTPPPSSSTRKPMEAQSQQGRSSGTDILPPYSGDADDEGELWNTPSQDDTGVAVLPTASSQGLTAQNDLRIQLMKQEHELRMKLLQEDHDTTLELKRKRSDLEIKLLQQQEKQEAEIFEMKRAKLQKPQQGTKF